MAQETWMCLYIMHGLLPIVAEAFGNSGIKG